MLKLIQLKLQITKYLFILLTLASTKTISQNSTKPDSSFIITDFKTRILYKDSIWNTNKPIYIPTQPALLSIYFQDKKDSLNPNFICILMEPMTMLDTLHLGKSNVINFNNLAGGDYTLTFINLKNGHSRELKFSVAFVFWQRWWFSPFLFLITSIILGIIFYFIFLIRTRSKLHLQSVRHELEIKALRAQMNPHFIFNCLNTIDAYIVRKQFIEASDCLQKFSQLIRHILENSEFQTIRLDQEIKTLRLYIELEQERFAHTFRYELTVDPSLMEDSYQIPPLLLQPFVENAILHGLRHLKNREGMLKISLQQALVNQKESLFCQIEDNGIGREASAHLNEHHREHHKSMGMNVTFERITAHQAHYGELMKTQIEDLSSPHTGTVVRLWLPLLTQFWQKK